MKRPILLFLRSALIVYVVLVVLVAGFQRRLIYQPSRALASEEKLARVAAPLGLEPWRDPAGQQIGWRQIKRDSGPARNRLIVFHGNAGSALDRSFFAQGFGAIDDHRTWQVFLFEYPGYDFRPGELSEKSFRAAAQLAFEQLAAEDARPLFFAGESLGSGPACALAGALPGRVAGVFLFTPFAALSGVAAHLYPWLPVRLILRDRWENAAALQGYRGPVAVMLAGQDEVVTLAEGQALFDGYAGPKRRWIDREATHNAVPNAPRETWWSEVSDFLLAR